MCPSSASASADAAAPPCLAAVFVKSLGVPPPLHGAPKVLDSVVLFTMFVSSR